MLADQIVYPYFTSGTGMSAKINMLFYYSLRKVMSIQVLTVRHSENECNDGHATSIYLISEPKP